MFSKRHYIAVAETLFRSAAKANVAHETIVAELADLFERDNDSFDRERFIHACNTGEILGRNIRGGPAMPYGYSGAKWDSKLNR